MAQAGYTPISLYYSTTAAAVPVNTNLVSGELAINITDGKLYYKDNTGTVKLLAGATAGPAGGSNTQVQFNSSGVLAGSANLTFNGTTLTANTIGAFTLGGTIAGGGNQINNVIIGTSTPLAGAFTTLSATGDLTLSGATGRVVSDANNKRVLMAGGASATTTTGGYIILEGYDYGGAGAGGAITLVSAAGTTNPITMSVGGTTRGVFSSTGLAVTGTATSNGYTFNYNTSYWNVDGYLSNYSATNGVYLNGNASGWLHLNADGTQAARIKLYGSSNATPNIIEFTTASTERLRIASTGAFGLSGANYGTSGQVLTSGGSGAAPTWTTVGGGGGSAATPTALGTVYGSMTANVSPYTTALGYNAGLNNTGTYNVFVGLGAGQLNTSGGDNVVVGVNALYSNLTGTGNTAVGRAALNTSTAGTNTAVGFFAGAEISTGSQNTSIGRYSGGANAVSTGTANTSVGNYAGYRFTTGNYNVAVGAEALQANTTGSTNTAVGQQALYSNTASFNTAIGYQSLYSNSTGPNNVAVGYQAGYSTITASGQTHVGDKAGRLATGEWNTLIGLQAGENITTGIQNTLIGAYNGNYVTALTTGSYNITIGTYSGPSASNSNYELVMGYNVRGKGSSTGFIYANGGGIYQGNNSSTWSTTSDQRLKKNIVDNNIGLDAITSIRVRNFEYRLPEEVDAELKPTDAVNRTGVQLGVIAQELQAVLPDCVKQESTGVLSVDTDNLTWYLINAVKELKAEVDSLKSQLNQGA